MMKAMQGSYNKRSNLLLLDYNDVANVALLIVDRHRSPPSFLSFSLSLSSCPFVFYVFESITPRC
jgi:hypothetical protein